MLRSGGDSFNCDTVTTYRRQRGFCCKHDFRYVAIVTVSYNSAMRQKQDYSNWIIADTWQGKSKRLQDVTKLRNGTLLQFVGKASVDNGGMCMTYHSSDSEQVVILSMIMIQLSRSVLINNEQQQQAHVATQQKEYETMRTKQQDTCACMQTHV